MVKFRGLGLMAKREWYDKLGQWNRLILRIDTPSHVVAIVDAVAAQVPDLEIIREDDDA
jgi:hypothetical protein